MIRSVETFVALRYLVSRSKLRFINVIGVISIIGITIGVAALLVALSVFNGFNGVVTDVLVGFDPHLRVEKKGGLTPVEISDIEHQLKTDSRIKAYAPFISGKAMLVARSFNKVVFIRGVDAQRVGEVSGLKEKMVLGSLTFSDSSGENDIILGLTLADRLGSVVGDEITLISPYGFQSGLSGVSVPPTVKFRITGIYESNNREYDGNYAYIPLHSAQDVFHLENNCTGIEMRLHDFKLSDDVKKSLEQSLPSNVSVSSWYDLHKNLYAVMKIERWSAYILLCLIIVVASFNMLGSLSMSVIEKRRDIGVLKTMGMPAKRIVRIFRFEGIFIGVAGTVAGIVIGLVVLFLQIHYQLFALDTTVYIIPAIPVKIIWTDFIAVALASIGCSYVASFYPARRAASTLPAIAIRWE